MAGRVAPHPGRGRGGYRYEKRSWQRLCAVLFDVQWYWWSWA
jgi:hypothetical protein